MARVGILAFGSLIGTPGAEIKAVEVTAERRRGVLTPFSVEFARSSAKRGGAPTLVPYPNGKPVNAEIIVVEATAQLAKDALWRRETDNLDSKDGYRERNNPGPNTLVIRTFENFDGLPLVLAAAFPANIHELTPTALAELAVRSARDRTVGAGRDGISYLIDAKAHGIITPLSSDLNGKFSVCVARRRLSTRWRSSSANKRAYKRAALAHEGARPGMMD